MVFHLVKYIYVVNKSNISYYLLFTGEIENVKLKDLLMTGRCTRQHLNWGRTDTFTQLRIQYLARFNMQTGGTGDQTADLPDLYVTRPALPLSHSGRLFGIRVIVWSSGTAASVWQVTHVTVHVAHLSWLTHVNIWPNFAFFQTFPKLLFGSKVRRVIYLAS